MDSDCDGSTICDDVMGSAYVRDDGSFIVTGKGGDPGGYSWSRPDIYVRVIYNDDHGVRLTDELNLDRYFDTPQHAHNNVEGNVDIGRWTSGVGVRRLSPTQWGEGTKPGVWHCARAAYREYQAQIGKDPPAGHYDVEYWSAIWAGTPWTNDDTTHWPIHYPTVAMRHEFGHSVRHAFDGDRNHFNWDVTRFRYARNHDHCDSAHFKTEHTWTRQGFAFNEGWAEYWADDTAWCPNAIFLEEVEGSVAHALGLVSNSPAVGRKGMVVVLRAHPGQIHSLDEFLQWMAHDRATAVGVLRQAISASHRVIAHSSRPWILFFSATSASIRGGLSAACNPAKHMLLSQTPG